MGWLAEISRSEMLFYGGIIMMAAAALAAVPIGALLVLTGRRLKRKLEQEYGKPQR